MIVATVVAVTAVVVTGTDADHEPAGMVIVGGDDHRRGVARQAHHDPARGGRARQIHPGDGRGAAADARPARPGSTSAPPAAR